MARNLFADKATPQTGKNLFATDAPAPQISGGAQFQGEIPKEPTSMQKILAGGLGAAEGVSEKGQALGQLGDWALNKIFGTHLKAPKGSFFVGGAAPLEKLPQAKYGKMAGGILGDIAIGAPLGRLTEGAPLLNRLLAYGGTAAATQPGGAGERIGAAALGAAGGAADYIGSVLRHAPSYLSDTSLAKNLFKVGKKQKDIAKNLYNIAFKGVGHKDAMISKGTEDAISELKTIKKGKAAYTDALNAFENNKTIKGMHKLRSDLAKEQAYLSNKKALGKLTGTEDDKLAYIKKVNKGLSKDLEDVMNSHGEDAYSKYMEAQTHWKNNVVPFRDSRAVHALLKNGEIKGTLRSHLAAKYIPKSYLPASVVQSGKRLRELTGLMREPLADIPKLKKGLGKAGTYGTALYLLGKEHGYHESRGLEE